MGLQKIESCAIIDLSFSGTDFHGDVAQLGERTVRIRKVESSILFVSTMPFGARQNISRLAAAGLLFWLIGHFVLVFIPMKLDIVWFHRYFIFFLKR